MRDKSSIKSIKSKIVNTLKKQGVVKAGIFGSYARGEQTPKSDIDILIEVKGRKFSIFDLVGLKIKLENLTGKEIDLVTYAGISPYLKQSILSNEVRII